MFTGSRPIREKKDKQGKTIYLLTFQLQKLKEATVKENWMKSSDTQESFYICHDAVGIGLVNCEFAR